MNNVKIFKIVKSAGVIIFTVGCFFPLLSLFLMQPVDWQLLQTITVLPIIGIILGLGGALALASCADEQTRSKER